MHWRSLIRASGKKGPITDVTWLTTKLVSELSQEKKKGEEWDPRGTVPTGPERVLGGPFFSGGAVQCSSFEIALGSVLIPGGD